MGYVWLGIVCLLLVLFAIFPLRVRVEYGYSKNASKQRLTVWLNGLSVYKTEFNARIQEKKKKDEEKTETDDESRSFEVFMNKIRFYSAAYECLKPDLIRFLTYFQKSLKVPKYIMHLDFGFPDAANTGIAAGAAYGVVYSLSALLYNNLNLKKKDMDVYVAPHFHTSRIDFYFNGIFQLRMVHIIKAIFMLVSIYNKFIKFKRTNEGGAKL